MVKKRPEESVHDEQFGIDDNNIENKETSQEHTSNINNGSEDSENQASGDLSPDNTVNPDEQTSDNESLHNPKNTDEQQPETEDINEAEKPENHHPENELAEDTSTPEENASETDSLKDNEEAEDHDEKNEDSDNSDKSKESHIEDIEETNTEEADELAPENNNNEEAGETDSDDNTSQEVTNEEKTENTSDLQNKPEIIDYSALSKEDLVASLRDLMSKGSVYDIKDDVDQIKINFYKKQKAELEKKRKKFTDEGGAPEDFKPEEEQIEKELKEYLARFKDYKTEYNKHLEEEKQHNLEEKYKIIEEIKDLVNRKESINKTFQEFRELQQRWREAGPVPQQSLNDLWETYHHHVETFYDYIKINQELRDLDLKKNLEAKIGLCEKAEELLLEPNVITAFNTLQHLHSQWREIGPVPREMRTDIWKRFKDTTSKINKKHQEYFLTLKQEQKKNLEAKILLCEKAEEITGKEIKSFQEWEKLSHELIDLQKVWRTIGFAPKKDNNKIYKRFRDACDNFFNRKRDYYSHARQEQDDNLQLKIDLCVQAEALQDSTEWKKTTEELIELQKKWKEIGPVPYKHSDKVWKRFRSACDKFFECKSKHFSTVDSSYESNLKKKEELIEKIENLELSSKVENNLNKLKEFQREWANIGFVPYEVKDEIQEKYRKAINQKFDALKIDDDKKNLLKFKSKLENLTNKQNSDYRINQERDKFISKVKQLENDIVLWENNIGFFAKSKNAESMIKEVQRKIDDAKSKIEVLNEKIRMIDDFEEEED